MRIVKGVRNALLILFIAPMRCAPTSDLLPSGNYFVIESLLA
jgi:hypothetical protein